MAVHGHVAGSAARMCSLAAAVCKKISSTDTVKFQPGSCPGRVCGALAESLNSASAQKHQLNAKHTEQRGKMQAAEPAARQSETYCSAVSDSQAQS